MRQGETTRLHLATPDDAELLSRWRDDPDYIDQFQEGDNPDQAGPDSVMVDGAQTSMVLTA